MTELAPRQPAERLSRSMVALSFAGAFAFLYLRTFLLPATPFAISGDQNLFFARALRLLHGQVMYRDFFEMVTPGTELLYAAGFRLFGVHAWEMAAWSIAIGLALCSVITSIASKMFRGPLILLPALLFLIFDFNSGLDLTHHWFSTLFVLAAADVLMGGMRLRRIFAAGALCGIATLFTQTQGGLAFLALAVYILWFRRYRTAKRSVPMQLAALTLPFALILFCVLGYYVYRAGFNTVFFDIVVFPVRFLKSQGYFFQIRQIFQVHHSEDILRMVPFLFIYALVPYLYLLSAQQLWRKRETLLPTLLQHLVLLHLAGLALFLAIAHGPRFFRLCTVAPPAILICTWLVSQPSHAYKLARRLLFILAVFFALLLSLHRQTQFHGVLNLPVGRAAFSDPLEFREFQWFAQRTHPSEPFFNDGTLGLYLSLNNPTPVEFITYDEFTRPEQVTAIVQSLQRQPPHFIAAQPEDMESSGSHDHGGPFRQYLHDHYDLVQTFDKDHSYYREEIWEIKSASNK